MSHCSHGHSSTVDYDRKRETMYPFTSPNGPYNLQNYRDINRRSSRGHYIHGR